MKIKIWGVILFAGLAGCAADKQEGRFTVTGELKNIKDQKIYLEQLYFSEKDPEILDTGEIKNGTFELSAIAAEEGLFRIRLENNDPGYVLINDVPEITVKADANNKTVDGFSVSSPANAKLKNLLSQLSMKGQALQHASVKLDSLKATGNGSSSLAEMKKMHELDADFKNYVIRFIDTASDPIVSMFALGYTRNINPEELKEVVPNLAKRFPKHQGVAALVQEYNKIITAATVQPQNSNRPGIGVPAPDIKMNDVNDNPYSLSQLKGKYVLVDFWASWCGPCRGENPNIVAAYEKYKHKNFTVLGVSLDEKKDAWLKAIKDDGLTWHQISDLKGWNSDAASLYGFDAIPYNVLVDPSGKIIATTLRGSDLEKKLEEVLQ